MKDEDRPRFAAAMNRLAAGFQVQVTQPLLEAYWDGLEEGVDIQDFEGAVRLAVKERDKLPRPVELRKLSVRAYGKRTGQYYLPGTGWVNDPWSKERQIADARAAPQLAHWSETERESEG